MKTNAQIRQETLSSMKGNWGSGMAVVVVYVLIAIVISCIATSLGELFITGVDPLSKSLSELSAQFVSGIMNLLLVYPMEFAVMMMFLAFIRGEQSLTVGGVFKAFNSKYYGKSVGVLWLAHIFTFLWALLLIVPGIIKGLSYSLAPYILADNMELTANEAIEKSMKMMKGHKMQLFLILLGYAGFALLSVVALCIPLLWLTPYYQSVMAKFYEEVKSGYVEEAC